MTNSSAGSLLQAVSEVARRAGAVALAHYHSTLVAEWKADGSPVTIADRAAEQEARSWIEQYFPDDGILGEEFGTTRPDARRQWIVDPIDGTKSFIRRVPLWGTLIAIREGSRVLAGAACLPAAGETVVAALGEGAWWNDIRCRVSDVDRLSDATITTTDERFPAASLRRAAWRSLADEVMLARSWGDCFGYVLVATGRADVMADAVLSPWDAAPFLPIISEAGGVFTDWEATPRIDGGSAIATNARLATIVRRRLGCPPFAPTPEVG